MEEDLPIEGSINIKKIKENMLERKIKFLSRKDFREKFTEQEAKEFLTKAITTKSKEEIETELRKIYDSSLEELSSEDESGIIIFDKVITL